jgi:hypothetical protein
MLLPKIHVKQARLVDPTHMSLCTGPLRGIFNKARAGRIQFNISEYVPNMAELNRPGEKPLLPHMASSAATNVLPEKGDTVA